MKKIITSLFLFLLAFSSFAQVPANDACANAQAIVIPSSGSVCVTSSNANATSDLITDACDTGVPGNEVWFTYIVSGANNTITVTPTGATPATNLVVTVMSTGCGSGTYEVCNSGTGSNPVTTSTGLVPGSQVWVSVETNGTDGGFQLCINSVPPDPTPGNTCATATNICTKASFDVSSLAGFSSSGVQPGCFTAAVKKDVWIKFTVGTTGTLEFTGTPLAAVEFDWAVYNVTSGCLGSLVSCNYDYATSSLFGGCGTPGATFGMLASTAGQPCPAEFNAPITVTAGNTYAILIDNFTASNDGFSIDWGGTFQIAPTAAFTATPTSSCTVPQTVTITNTSVGATNYTWNFGDGSASTTATNPGSHNYTTNGDYLISLVATGGGCTSVTSQRINLNTGAVISITPAAPTICQGSSVALTGTLALGTPYNDRQFSSNPNVAIPNNSTTGITNNVTSSGMLTTTITSGMVQQICFTINHTKHSDISVAEVTVNGTTYSYTPLPLPNANGTATYCFPASVIAAINAAGGSSNTTWTLKLEDTRGGGGGTGSLVSWNVVLRDPNSITSYAWAPTTNMTGSTTLTPTVSPASTTTYTLSATDKFGCTSSKTVVVTVHNTPTATISGTTTICSGGTPATISVALTGTAPWSLTYTNGTTPVTVSGIASSPYTFTTSSAGTYSLTAVNDASCTGTVSGTAVITTNPAIVTSGVLATCSGDNLTYTVSFNITGGNPATYSVTPSGTLTPGSPYTFTSNSIAAGTPYSFSVTDTYNCSPQTVSGSQICNGCNVTASVSGGGTVCAGTPAPDVVFTLSGGTSMPYTLTYAINGVPQAPVNTASSSYTIPSPAAGTYSIVSIADASCLGSGSGSASVSFIPLPTATVSGGGAICNNGSTTTVTITLTGTSPWNLTYDIDGVSQAPVTNINTSPYSITTSTGGVYTVSAISNATCTGTSSGSANVVVNPLPTATVTGGGTVCAGSTLPDASVALTGQSPWTITYAINGVDQSPVSGITTSPYTITAISAGTYSVSSVSDANGCSNTGSGNAIVVVNSKPTAVITGGGSVCSGNPVPDINIALTGTPDWTIDYTIDGVSQPQITGITSSPYTFTNPAAGTYVVTSVSDATTCSQAGTGSASSVINALPTATVTGTTSFCLGDSTTLDGSSSTAGSGTISNYQWQLNGTDITGATSVTYNALAAGNYTLVVTNTNNCSATSAGTVVTVNTPPAIDTTNIVITAATCGNLDGSITGITTTGTPVLSYAWNGGASSATSDLSSLSGGSYTLVATDGNGCSSMMGPVIVPSIGAPPAPVVDPVAPVCAGQSFTVSVNSPDGSATYTWTGPGGALGTGTSINVNNSVGADAGTYSVTATVAGCTSTPGSTVVTINALPTASITGTTSFCPGDSTTLDASSSVAGSGTVSGYQWQLNGTDIPGATSATYNALAGGNYTVIVTNSNTCSSASSVTAVTVNAAPVIDTTNMVITQASCGMSDGSITLITATGATALTYTWNGAASATTDLLNAAAGTYTIVATDQNGCSSSIGPITITNPAAPAAPIAGNNGPQCEGSSLDLSANTVSNATYSWTGPNAFTSSSEDPNVSGSSTVAMSGTYSVTVTVNGCTSLPGTTNVVVNAIPAAPVAGNNGPVCAGSSLDLTSNTVSNATYSWTGPNTFTSSSEDPNVSTSATVAMSGTYSVTVTVNGCTSSQGTTLVTVNPIPVANAGSDAIITCGTNTVILNGSGSSAGTYSWAPSANVVANGNTSSPTVNAAGTYTLTVTSNGCSATDNVIVTVDPTPLASFSSNPSSGTPPLTVNFTNSSQNANTFTWFFGDGNGSLLTNPSEIYTIPGTYSVMLVASDNSLCPDTTSGVIVVNENFSIIIPNIFTPNGDAHNDVFKVTATGVTEFKGEIYDRWGLKLGEWNDVNDGWKGEAKSGAPTPDGTYYYIMTVKGTDDKEHVYKGHLELLR